MSARILPSCTHERRRRLASTTAITVLAAFVFAGVLAAPDPALAAGFTDVPPTYWDSTAITYVASTNTWMQDFGTTTFKPHDPEARKYLARALVLAFAATTPVDSTIHFTDMPDTDPYYQYANVAVQKGWLPKYQSGAWAPNGNVQASGFDQALILALGTLSTAVNGLANIHQASGTAYTVVARFPYLVLAHYLGLHYNHSDETADIQQTTVIPRDEAAYSLWKAKTLYSWQITNANRFAGIELPTLNPTTANLAAKAAVTQYALSQVGYPYIWGGEWNAVSPSGYCCGYQPQAGMDCSGFTWWVMKKYEDGYNAAQFRSTYTGWVLHDRSSTDMAKNTTTHIAFKDLRVGDLMFFASNGGTTYSDVDHVGVFIGNNWLIHSASSNDGVVLEWLGSGWYYDRFVYGRRLIGVAAASSTSGALLEDQHPAIDGGASESTDWRLEGDSI